MSYADAVAELDYAFLAEFAKVDRGLLSSAGASYTHVFFSKPSTAHMLFIAGRIRADVGENPNLSIRAVSPESEYEITFEVVPSGLSEIRPYGGNRNTFCRIWPNSVN